MRLRPHHLIDIVTGYGHGDQFTPHPYGHALHTVAERVIGNLDAEIELVLSADDICAPCCHLRPDGRCDDMLGQLVERPSKQVYNDALDGKLFAYFDVPPGARMTVREFLARLGERTPGIEEICTHPGEKQRDRLNGLRKGLAGLGVTMTHTAFSEADIQALSPTLKIGLLGTVNDAGLPHLTLISTLQAGSPTQVIWGQFTEGLSKQFVRQNPHTGFLILTLDKRLWRGKATFTHTAQQGPEYDMYNNTPMFRYNAYFGVHTVYYMDLVEHHGREALPMSCIVYAAIQTMIAKTLAGRKNAQAVLNPWTRRLMNKLDNLKFLAYVGADGYPVIIPVIQAQAASGERIIFSTTVYRDELEAIPSGAIVAVFGMALSMEDVLLRGEFQGLRGVGGVRCGCVRVNWVYNSMPPKPQQIYPEVTLEPVTTF